MKICFCRLIEQTLRSTFHLTLQFDQLEASSIARNLNHKFPEREIISYQVIFVLLEILHQILVCHV